MGGNFGKFSVHIVLTFRRRNSKCITNLERPIRNYNIHKLTKGSIFPKFMRRGLVVISTCIEPMSSIVGNSSFWNILTRYGSNRCIYRYSKFSSNIHKCPECIYLYNRNDVDRVKQPEVVFC